MCFLANFTWKFDNRRKKCWFYNMFTCSRDFVEWIQEQQKINHWNISVRKSRSYSVSQFIFNVFHKTSRWVKKKPFCLKQSRALRISLHDLCIHTIVSIQHKNKQKYTKNLRKSIYVNKMLGIKAIEFILTHFSMSLLILQWRNRLCFFELFVSLFALRMFKIDIFQQKTKIFPGIFHTKDKSIWVTFSIKSVRDRHHKSWQFAKYLFEFASISILMTCFLSFANYYEIFRWKT